METIISVIILIVLLFVVAKSMDYEDGGSDD